MGTRFLYQMIFVGIGGIFGTSFRFGLNNLISNQLPIQTLIENLLGSFLLGLLFGIVSIKSLPEWVQAGVGTGLLGSFTTMSTFASEMFEFITEEQIFFAFIYFLLSILGGMGLAMLGIVFGKKWALKGT